MIETRNEPAADRARERLLRLLAFATFIIFFQAYMVAPIIPTLSERFHATVASVGLIVPAYLIPYGIATLAYGLLADRVGIHRVMFVSLAAFAVLTLLTASAHSIEALAFWRLLTGIGASGVVPLALALVGRLYSYERRGRALGWIFGAMAGGMAFGAPLGALVVPVIGWQGLFVLVGACGIVILAILWPSRRLIASAAQPVMGGLGDVMQGYKDLLGSARGRRTYAYVFLNSMFHSGVFTWLAVYLERHYTLSPTTVGLALLGYGIPGFLFGPAIGRAADRWGRAHLIPWGLLAGAAAVSFLLAEPPVIAIPLIAMLLSLGYDMTQPLFGGIVTSLGGQRAGQAMGLNVFTLFLGFGLGSLIFGALLPAGFSTAFSLFLAGEFIIGLLAFAAFRTEIPIHSSSPRAAS